MTGFKDTSFNDKVAVSILRHVIVKVSICFTMMVQDCIQNGKKLNNDETDIRDYLFYNYLNNDAIMKKIGFDDFRFFSEVPENYKENRPLGRTDLQVISIDNFRHRQRYFIIECKRIDGNLSLNRHYISDGVRRFVGLSPKYTSFFKSNCMLGFLVKDIDIRKNVNKLNTLLQTDYADINVQVLLTPLVSSENELPDTYVSIRTLDKSTSIILFHKFVDCVPVVV